MLDVLGTRKVRLTTVDGANPQNKDQRSALWSISQKRAVYPQLFVKKADGTFEFVCDFDGWTLLVEMNELDHRLDALVGGLDKE